MKEISYTWFFEQPVETVWQYLTDAELLGQWLMPNDIKPVVGHNFMFRVKPVPQIDFDGNVYCEVLEVSRPHTLVYTWRGGPAAGQITLDTVVRWTLAPKDNGTELSLLQTGFKEDQNAAAYQSMNKGWGDHILSRLRNLITNTTNETAKN